MKMKFKSQNGDKTIDALVDIRLKETNEGLNLGLVKETYVKIAELHKIAKGLRKDDSALKVVQSKLTALRAELKGLGTMAFRIEAKSKNSTYWEAYGEKPSRDDIRGVGDAFLRRIKEHRKKLKSMSTERRDVIGFSYESMGGVMTEPGTIVNLLRNTDPIRRVRAPKVPMKKSQYNYVGVELELIAKCDVHTLENALISAGLAGFVRVVPDGSLRHEQSGEHPHELNVMCKQHDLKEVMYKLDKVLKLGYIAAYVNNTCGLHVHIDCRNRDHKKVYRNLVNTIPVLRAMVPPDRTSGQNGEDFNRFCRVNTTDSFDAIVAEGDGGRESRYWIVNPSAYKKYNTIEIRLHSGSTNPVKIINWVTLLLAIADTNVPITSKVQTAAELGAMLSLPSKLVAYIEKRTELFRSKAIKDTRDDHFSTHSFEMAV